MCLGDVASPDSGGQSVLRAIRARDNFVDALKRNNAHDRPEDLFLGDLHSVLDIGEHGGLDKVAAVSDALTAADELCPFTPARFDVAHHLVELRLVHLRTLLRGGIERIADRAIPGAGAALFDKLIVNVLFHENARTGAAALAVIEEEAEVSAFYRL